MNNLIKLFRVLSECNYSFIDEWDNEDLYTLVELETGISEEDTKCSIFELCHKFNYLAGCIVFSENKENTEAVDVYVIHYANGIPYVDKLTLDVECDDLGSLNDVLDHILEETVYCEPGYASKEFNIVSYVS